MGGMYHYLGAKWPYGASLWAIDEDLRQRDIPISAAARRYALRRDGDNICPRIRDSKWHFA